LLKAPEYEERPKIIRIARMNPMAKPCVTVTRRLSFTCLLPELGLVLEVIEDIIE
jgi:hypothetical protein